MGFSEIAADKASDQSGKSFESPHEVSKVCEIESLIFFQDFNYQTLQLTG